MTLPILCPHKLFMSVTRSFLVTATWREGPRGACLPIVDVPVHIVTGGGGGGGQAAYLPLVPIAFDQRIGKQRNE